MRRVCYVAVAANRGLCGSYNLELVRYLAEVLAEEKQEYSVVLCGRWLRDNAAGLGIGGVIRWFDLPDVPDYAHALELTRYLRELWESGQADQVVFVTQRFRNILSRAPGLTPFLPFGAAGEGGRDEYLFVPDPEEHPAGAGGAVPDVPGIRPSPVGRPGSSRGHAGGYAPGLR